LWGEDKSQFRRSTACIVIYLSRIGRKNLIPELDECFGLRHLNPLVALCSFYLTIQFDCELRARAHSRVIAASEVLCVANDFSTHTIGGRTSRHQGSAGFYIA